MTSPIDLPIIAEPPPCGTLYSFPTLPDRATRDAFVEEAIGAMAEELRKTDLASLPPEADPAFVRKAFDRLTAHLASTRDLATRMKAARDGGDARAEDRLFRSLVIAKWRGGALIEALRDAVSPPPAAMRMSAPIPLEGGRMLVLVAQTGHSREIRLIAFNASGSQLITAAGDGRAISWAAATGEELHTLWLDSTGLRDPTAVALSSDGKRMVVGAQRGFVVHYPLRGVDPLRPESESPDWPHGVPFHARAVQSIAFSSDGGKLVSSGAATVVWAAGVDKLTASRWFGKREGANSSVAALSPRGDLVLTAGDDHEAILWNAVTGAKVRALAGHAAPLKTAAFSADGAHVATLDTSGVMILWNANTAARIVTLSIPDEPTSMALTPDGRALLTVSPAGVRLWELGANPPAPWAPVTRALAGIQGTISAAALSPSAALPLLVVGTSDGALHAIDYFSGEQVWSVEAMRLAPIWIDFAAGGRRFTVTREDGTAHEWDAQAGGLVVVRPATAAPPSPKIETLSFSRFVIRDPESGEEIGYYEGYFRLARVERLARLGRWLLAHEDGRARVLDERPAPGQWLFQATCVWDATIEHLTTAAISPDGRFVLGGTRGGTVELWKVGETKRLCTLLSQADGQWAVADDEGRYDSSQRGRAAGLHWVLDMEPIELAQLKIRYYDPTLLTKKMELRAEPVRAVTRLAPKLFPAVETTLVTSRPRAPAPVPWRAPAPLPALHVRLVDRGGGIGTIRIAINGKEAFAGRLAMELPGHLALLPEDRGAAPIEGQEEASDYLEVEARFDEATGAVREASFDFPLANHPYLLPGDPKNQVTVVVMDTDDVLASRGAVSRFAAAGMARAVKPTLWAVVAGISRYQDPRLQLTYSGKDAVDFGKALELAGAALFDGRVHVEVLSTDAADPKGWPQRSKLEAAFHEIARAAKSEDVLVVYLSGHGVQAGAGRGDEFHYLTQDAVEDALFDPVVWHDTTLSSRVLTTWLKDVPALKQVLVLDTCHAGRLVENLMDKREVPSSYQRAMERMKDRTGLFVLAGSAADAVSYEASRYAQGLLTYALLEGMRGAALREEALVDVATLFGYAVDEVPRLAEGIGGIQRPLVAMKGGSFDIGAVDASTRARIPRAATRPIVQRSSFQDDAQMDDVLALAAKVDAALRDLAAARPPSFVFVEGVGMPDAFRLAGRYSRMPDGSMKVTVRVFHDHRHVGERVVEGRADALDALVRRIAEVVLESIRGQPASSGPR